MSKTRPPAHADLLAELDMGGVELALTGFSGGEVDRLLAGIRAATDPDDAPAPPEKPESQVGEIYQLGQHRLACGDARDSVLVEKLVAKEQPEVIWTDPPYGVSYVGKTTDALTIANDSDPGQIGSLLEQAFRMATPLLAASARFYVACPAGPQGTVFRQALANVSWTHTQTLVWVKNNDETWSLHCAASTLLVRYSHGVS